MSGAGENPNEHQPDSANPVLHPSRRPFNNPAPLKHSLKVIANRRDVYKAKLIFYLFLGSLTVFFLGGMVSYWIIRTQSFQPIAREYLGLRVPMSFWLSTLTLIFVSGFLQRAVWCIRREYQYAFRRWMVCAWISSLAFLLIQSFGMHQLWEIHFAQIDGTSKAYGLCFTLAFLHALHVLGGIIFLAFVIYQGYKDRYDHERNFAVEHCAAYWHFLDVVWLLMLLTFVTTG